MVRQQFFVTDSVSRSHYTSTQSIPKYCCSLPHLNHLQFPETVPDDIPDKRCLVFKWSSNKLKDTLNFRKLIKTNKIDVVHSWDYKSNYLEALACRMAGVKYIYTKKKKKHMLLYVLNKCIYIYIFLCLINRFS